MAKRVLITGVAGQAGSYLAEFLLSMGYKVFGLLHRGSANSLYRISHIQDRIVLLSGDLLDYDSLLAAIETSEPDEVYNLAAQTYIPASWDQPVSTGEFTALGVARLLEAIRAVNGKIRFYQASTSEVFGKVEESPQNETTPFRPRSPYGVAKCYGHWLTSNYREHYDMFACAGICYNHESPRRDLSFVTRKISYGAAQISLGLKDKLEIGSLDACRDWGFTGDYVKAMWMMLQQQQPQDYVIATGISHSVLQFCELAFNHAHLDWRKHVVSTPALTRSTDTNLLRGDASKAHRELGWKPETSFEVLIRMLVDHDINLLTEKIDAKKGARA